MKKQTAALLAAVIFAASLSACTRPVTVTTTEDETEEEETTVDDGGIMYSPGSPSHNLSDATITETLPDYYLEEYDAPWGSKYDLRTADKTIKNKFVYYIYDENDNIVNECLNDISTITRPQVKVFPAEQDGYIMYEITYTQLLPLRSRQPEYYSSNMYFYYDLDFVDYYTGMKYPWMNIVHHDGVGSHIIQDYHYKDGTYRLEYYEFVESETLDSSLTHESDGMVIYEKDIKRTTTCYLIVPEDYDGIMMYVYVGDDVFWLKDNTGDENQETTEKDRQDHAVYNAEPFGDEAHIGDYVFIGITVPK